VTQVATRAGPETASSTRTAADLAADPTALPTTVPRPVGESTVVALAPYVAGGLAAVQAEWGVDGGAVVLAGQAPFADLTARAGFRTDGTLDGTVEVRARVGLLGLDLGEAAWRVDGWSPEVPLAAPTVTLRGTTVDVDLRPLPPGAAWSAREGVPSREADRRATVQLPSGAVDPGEPLSPRLAEVYRGLLGLDTSRLRVHADAAVAGAPAFVTDQDLFLAPGIYGVDSPGTLRILDAAVRAALAGLVGAVTGEPAPVATSPPAPPTASAAAPAAAPVEAPVTPGGQAQPAAEPTTAGPPGETAEQATAAVAGGGDVVAPVEGEVGTGAGAEAEAEAAPAEEGQAPLAVELIMPEPPTTLGPAAAARGGGVAHGAGGAARAARDLPTADATVADSRSAVTEPAAETAARAREDLAAELGERPAPSPEIVELAERIRTAIRENRPEDEDELLETDPTHEAQSAGATVTGSVEGQVQEVGSSYDAMSAPPGGTPALTPTPLDQPSPTSPGMGVDAASAAPDPIPPENTTLDADVAATDQRIADSGIDTRVTREIPDGPFAEARDARTGLGEVAERTPQQIQAEQQQAIDSAQADMAALQQQAVAAMRSARAGTVGTVGTGQTGMVASEENTRESVSQRAQRIFDDAQRQVDQLLQPLGRTAIARWEAGLARLSQDFHDTLNRVKRWIDERHSGVGGTLLAIGDYIGGLPDWVTDEYNRAEREFGDGVAALLLDISSDVNGVVAAAQALVQHARSDIDAAFAAMEAEFPEWAAQERARFSGMLDGLSQRVTDSQTSFVRDVSQRAITAVNEVHAEAQARRDEAGGLIGRVAAAIQEFIDDPVRAIINGLLRLVGIPPGAFWALIARIEQVISDIADDPENFINNLVAGVKQGFQQFFDNFGSHVLHGFWDWLFSGLETPIPMPRDFSPGSLFSFALQLMGITWPRVREILVRHVGPTAVEVIEAAWQLISVLIERGPEGIVEMIKEQLTPENIVNTILEAAVEYLMETLIQQVVVRVIGMLNPAGAIAQAIDLIYQVCSWIFRNAARIFRFVEAVVNGMADVIAGNIGGLANAVERALASLIPPVIDFLAGLLHLGGLPGEVAEVITRLQATVYAAMDRVIGFLAERGRALLARLGIGGEEEGDGDDGDTELGKTVRFTADGESHRVYVEKEGATAHLMVASTPTTIPDWISRWEGKLAEGTPAENTPERTEAQSLLGQLGPAAEAAGSAATALVAGFEAAAQDPEHHTPAPDDSAVESAEQSVASMLDRLFELFGEDDARRNLQAIRSALPAAGSQRGEVVMGQWKQEVIGPPRVKPVNGSEEAVWNVGAFEAGSALPNEVLASSANHAALLRYFERSEHPIPSPQFAAFALEEPGAGHPVRNAFMSSMGRRVAAQMRGEALASLAATAPDELLARIRAIAYTPDTGLGAFRHPFQSPVEVLVKGVFAGADFMTVLESIVQGPVNGVSFAELAAAVQASRSSYEWMKEELRRVQLGQHEWIPRSMMMRVLELAVDLHSRGDTVSAIGWVRLLGSLRSPTNSVIFRLRFTSVSVVRGPGDVTERQLPSVTAHAGAASYDPAGERIQPTFRAEGLTRDGNLRRGRGGGLTQGTGSFHEALRTFFRQNAPSMTPAAWVDALLAHLPDIMYTGDVSGLSAETLAEPIGVFVTLPSGVPAGDLTVGEFAEYAAARWREIQADFQAAKQGLPQ